MKEDIFYAWNYRAKVCEAAHQSYASKKISDVEILLCDNVGTKE